MSHKKAGGSSRNGRDSQAKRLGVKVFGGERVNAGDRQGTEHFFPAPDDLEPGEPKEIRHVADRQPVFLSGSHHRAPRDTVFPRHE